MTRMLGDGIATSPSGGDPRGFSTRRECATAAALAGVGELCRRSCSDPRGCRHDEMRNRGLRAAPIRQERLTQHAPSADRATLSNARLVDRVTSSNTRLAASSRRAMASRSTPVRFSDTQRSHRCRFHLTVHRSFDRTSARTTRQIVRGRNEVASPRPFPRNRDFSCRLPLAARRSQTRASKSCVIWLEFLRGGS